MEIIDRCEGCPELEGSESLCRVMVLEGLCELYPLDTTLIGSDIPLKSKDHAIETDLKVPFWQKPGYKGDLFHPKEEYL